MNIQDAFQIAQAINALADLAAKNRDRFISAQTDYKGLSEIHVDDVYAIFPPEMVMVERRIVDDFPWCHYAIYQGVRFFSISQREDITDKTLGSTNTPVLQPGATTGAGLS